MATRPRRRRSPAEAENEILRAAESFLRERPFRDMTVDEVMALTNTLGGTVKLAVGGFGLSPALS